MAKISRQPLRLFGGAGNPNNFEQFGSTTAGSTLRTKDIPTIQLLDAWSNGWQDAVIESNKAPFLEDMNAIMYVFGYELAYVLQAGIPEWDPDTTYYVGSYVTYQARIFSSNQDDNIGNQPLDPPATNNFWAYRKFDDYAGVIKAFAGTVIPPNYLLCDGAAVSRTVYAELFDVIGTIYGIGDGTTTFNVPDLRGRVPIGLAASGTFQPLGVTGGSETHTHTQVAHTHDIPVLSLDHSILVTSPFTVTPNQYSQNGGRMGVSPTPSGSGSVQQWFDIKATTIVATTGSATPAINSASNVPPFAVINYIIKT